jgi:hypothetical protein
VGARHYPPMKRWGSNRRGCPMYPHPLRRATTLLVLIGLAGWLLAACSDYARLPVALGDPDGGALIVVEPGDEFEVGLLGQRVCSGQVYCHR